MILELTIGSAITIGSDQIGLLFRANIVVVQHLAPKLAGQPLHRALAHHECHNMSEYVIIYYNIS